MKLAYFIMCHKNSRQVARLIHAIHDQDNIYLIHADRKAGTRFLEELKTHCAAYDNVHFMEPMIVSWGGWSLVEAQNKAMKQLLELDGGWDYFINLSGQCYPLQSQPAIKKFLSSQNNGSYVYFNNLEDPFYFRFFVERQETSIREVAGKAINTGLRRPYFSEVFGNDLYLSMGSQWVMLERRFCEFLQEDNPLIEKLSAYFRTFNIPDEHFIQTVVVNTPFQQRVVNNIYRYIHIPEHASHPQVLTHNDLEDLIASECLFARKVDDQTDSALLDALDLIVKGK